VIVVASGKGGVGTSTVATLLALVTAAGGRRTLLVDAADAPGARHLLFGTSGMMAGIEPFTGSDGMAPDADGIARVTSALSIATPALAQTSAVTRSPAELRAVVRALGSRFSAYRTVIVDGGSSLHSILAACEAGVDRLVLVTNSDRVCLAGAYAVIKAFGQRLGHRPVAIIGNRLDAESAAESAALLDSATHHFLERAIDFVGSIPDDACLAAGLSAGMTLADAVSDSPAAVAAESIAGRLNDTARIGGGAAREEQNLDLRGQVGSAPSFPPSMYR
jgi:flagellar biosynthesis protein FlhG